jgi:prepilin-type N-terminal cleavage/methylation domain-containing protein
VKISFNQKGFTMVELIVVIIILGVLAAIAVPKFLGIKDDAIEAACQTNMKAIEAAYLMKYSKALINDISTDFTSISLAGTDFTGGSVPACPQDGSAYAITPNADHTLTITCPNGHTLP